MMGNGNNGAANVNADSSELGALSSSASSQAAAASLPGIARHSSVESDPDLELQRISNMLLQPSPAMISQMGALAIYSAASPCST